MTTATVQSVDEAIREVLDDILTYRLASEPPSPGKRGAIEMAIQEIGEAISAPALEVLEWDRDGEPAYTEGVWMDLRRPEALRLKALVDAAIQRATDRSLAIAIEEITAAGLAFAAEFPDAPRGRKAAAA